MKLQYSSIKGAICLSKAITWSVGKNQNRIPNKNNITASSAVRSLTYSLLLTVYSLFTFSLSAQEPRKDSGADGLSAATPLRIGDKVPEEFWYRKYRVVQNNEIREMDLSGYRGRPLILDFWASWCAPCITSLSKVNTYFGELKQSGGFLAVTTDDSKIANAVWQRNVLSLPTVTDDTTLKRFFPHIAIPHLVWIDASGVLRFLSDQTVLSRDTVLAFFKGQDLVINQKALLDKNQPLLLDRWVDTVSLVEYRLVLKGYQQKLPALKYSRQTKEGYYSRTFINQSLQSIYRSLAYDLFYQRGRGMREDDFQIRTPDSLALQENYTCDIIAPARDRHDFYAGVVQVLNRVSGMCADMLSEKRPCLILERTADSTKLLTAGGKRQTEIDWNKQISLKNVRITQLVNLLGDDRITGKYIVNDTGYRGNIDLDLHIGRDLNEINRQLANIGLKLREDVRDVPVFVITTKNPIK